MANRAIAAVIDNLDYFMVLIVDLDTTQRALNLIRAEIAANGATYADAAAQLAQDRRRLAEALLVAAAARRAPPEPEDQHPAALPDPESELELDDEVIAALDQLVADIAELANRRERELQQQEEEEVVHLELRNVDPEVVARAVDYLQTAVHVERIQQREQILVQAQAMLVVVRAAAFAVSRAPLLPGVLLMAAMAYALAYVASGGAVVPGSASLLRISALVLCFLFGVPVVGNLA